MFQLVLRYFTSMYLEVNLSIRFSFSLLETYVPFATILPLVQFS